LAISSAKIPSRQELIPVFASILFCVSSWSIYRLLWYIPSWLFFLSIWDIAVILAYVLGFALFEGLLLLGLLILLSIILPPKYLRDKFILQGSLIVWLLAIWTLLLQRSIGYVYHLDLGGIFIYVIVVLFAITLSIIVASCLLLYRFNWGCYILAIADRIVIFFYLYGSLGLLSVAIVALRNIF
jgi:hypothetical protein